MEQYLIERLARQLQESEQTGQQLEQFSLRHPDMTINDAYAVQRAWLALKYQSGRSAIGHKIGLTSRAMQQASQINEPDYGTLLDDMLYHDGAELPMSRFILPRVEVEFAFILAKPLQAQAGKAPLSIFDVLQATDYVVPAIEIIDARIEQFDRNTKVPRKVVDTISDNAANAAIVLGGRPVKPDAFDLRWAGAMLYKNGVIEETGLGAGVLNHPANGIAWLANKLAQHDEYLRAGEIVLAGSFTRPVAAASGDVFHADYGSLGSVAFRFVGART